MHGTIGATDAGQNWIGNKVHIKMGITDVDGSTTTDKSKCDSPGEVGL